MAAYTDPNDILRLCAEAEGLLSWAPIPLGSPLRVHAYSLRKWKIMITFENIEWIQATSRAAIGTEWTPTDQSLNQLIADVCIKSGLSDANEDMNAKVGEYGAEQIIPILSGGKVAKVIDVGSGPGSTTLALLKQLVNAPLIWSSGLFIHLIDPSQKRLEKALEVIHTFIKGTVLDGKVHTVVKHGMVEQLKGIQDNSADLVVTNAALHHESFNEHWAEISRMLKPDCYLISGDWHESQYEAPARTYWIYYMLQNPLDDQMVSELFDFMLGKGPMSLKTERQELKDFRKLFDLDEGAVLNAYNSLTESERRANVGSMKYWVELGKRFKGNGDYSPEVILQCHERVCRRIEALKNAGFVFDQECRRKYVELLKAKGFGELTAVMMAKSPAR